MDFLVQHQEGKPDEVEADGYTERDGYIVFIREGKEILRLPLREVVSLAPRDES